jgi:hypothetical protein
MKYRAILFHGDQARHRIIHSDSDLSKIVNVVCQRYPENLHEIRIQQISTSGHNSYLLLHAVFSASGLLLEKFDPPINTPLSLPRKRQNFDDVLRNAVGKYIMAVLEKSKEVQKVQAQIAMKRLGQSFLVIMVLASREPPDAVLLSLKDYLEGQGLEVFPTRDENDNPLLILNLFFADPDVMGTQKEDLVA